jgi:hypothetical protein
MGLSKIARLPNRDISLKGQGIMKKKIAVVAAVFAIVMTASVITTTVVAPTASGNAGLGSKWGGCFC